MYNTKNVVLYIIYPAKTRIGPSMLVCANSRFVPSYMISLRGPASTGTNELRPTPLKPSAFAPCAFYMLEHWDYSAH